ncbi:hypothetical protein Tco_1578170 [Tanacetum coccineum]
MHNNIMAAGSRDRPPMLTMGRYAQWKSSTFWQTKEAKPQICWTFQSVGKGWSRSRVHNTFHVSNLKKCYADEPLAVPLDGLHIDDKLYFVEEPVEIMDREVK